MRNYDLISTILANFGLVMAIISYDHGVLKYDVDKGINKEAYPIASEHPRVTNYTTCFLRIAILLTTIISIVFLLLRQKYKMQWLGTYFSGIESQHPSAVEYMHFDPESKFVQDEDGDDETLQGDNQHMFTKDTIIELITMVMIPLPGFDRYIDMQTIPADSNATVYYTYLLSDFMLIIMYFRIAMLIRSVFNYTAYNGVFAKKLCKSYGFDTGTWFTIKSYIFIEPEKSCFILFTMTILIFGSWVRICEIPYQRANGSQEFDKFSRSIWFTIVTLFTVGYGDLYPGSDPGKIATVFLAFFGAILLALVVVSCSNIFNIEGKEKVALSHL